MSEIHRLALQLLAASPYAMPIEEARTEIRARRSRLLAAEPSSADPDFSAAEPMPTADPVHDALGYAAQFWKRKETRQEPLGRPSKSHPDSTLRILDGGKAPDGDNDP